MEQIYINNWIEWRWPVLFATITTMIKRRFLGFYHVGILSARTVWWIWGLVIFWLVPLVGHILVLTLNNWSKTSLSLTVLTTRKLNNWCSRLKRKSPVKRSQKCKKSLQRFSFAWNTLKRKQSTSAKMIKLWYAPSVLSLITRVTGSETLGRIEVWRCSSAAPKFWRKS